MTKNNYSNLSHKEKIRTIEEARVKRLNFHGPFYSSEKRNYFENFTWPLYGAGIGFILAIIIINKNWSYFSNAPVLVTSTVRGGLISPVGEILIVSTILGFLGVYVFLILIYLLIIGATKILKTVNKK